MAFAAHRPRAVDENAMDAGGKALGQGKAGAAPAGRRALGDLSTNVQRVHLGTSKDGAQKAAQPGGVMTRHQKALLAAQQQGQLKQGERKPLQLKQEQLQQPHAAPQPQQEQQHVAGYAPAASRTRKSMTSQLFEGSQAAVRSRQQLTPASPVPDIDSADADDPLKASSYATDIFSYYRRTEVNFRPLPTYMSRQADINDKMRAILIDWLVEVHLKFKLMPETLFLTTNLIDRFLEIKGVTRKNLQLVGVTAMLIASKYEEIWAPELNDFVYISDRAYKKDQILTMEKVMLNSLKFNLTVATPHNFLARFLKAADSTKDKAVRLYASYLIELALTDYSLLKFSYSQIAASAVYVARRAMNRGEPYPRSLQKHSGFTLEQLRPAATALAMLHHKAPNSSLPAVYKKYSAEKYSEIAKYPGPTSL